MVNASDTWWSSTEQIRLEIDALPFVTALGDGTLDAGKFRTYLEQDALYLRDYARALARASAVAPTREEQVFWARSAITALEGERTLHTDWLGGEPTAPTSATTRAYVDHLLSSGPDYPTIVAAVLPCFWIYQDVGERLLALSHAEHPYRRWLETYGDPEFAESTRQAIQIANLAAADASSSVQERMLEEFRISSEYELAFFNQAE